jgi:MoxR-like ATPase
LKRRCLYHWIDHPDLEREVKIVEMRVPGLSRGLAVQVAGAVGELRSMGLYKVPGVAETIDWAQALATLGVAELGETIVDRTLGTVLKYREDAERVRGAGIASLLQGAAAVPAAAAAAVEREA